jgi:serine/threonine protein kinase
MRNGTVTNYLSAIKGTTRERTVNRLVCVIFIDTDVSDEYLAPTRQIREIAQGLAFLHDGHVVHGDLRGVRPEYPF